MITLNLISRELKKEIKLRHIYNLVKKTSYILIIITIILTTILLIAKVILQNNFNKIVEQTTLVTKNNLGYNNKVRGINYKLNFISTIQDEFIYWSDLIKNLAEMTPGGITFSLVKIDLEKQTVKIKGRANLRDDLLILKQKMEESEIFKNIEFPLKNILEKKDIDFEIDAEIDIQKLKKQHAA